MLRPCRFLHAVEQNSWWISGHAVKGGHMSVVLLPQRDYVFLLEQVKGAQKYIITLDGYRYIWKHEYNWQKQIP